MKPLIYLSDCSGTIYRNKEDFLYVKKFMHDTVVKHVNNSGFRTEVRVTPEELNSPTSLEEYAGLIILGGYDIDPAIYGASAKRSTSHKSAAVDRREINLIHEAVSLNIPVFGICRGMQLINTAFGGTLHQDLPDSGFPHNNFSAVYPGDRLVAHPVEVQHSSALRNGTYTVASAHHQSVDRLGENLTVTAYSEDGVVEMVENPLLNIIGTQWHPEDSRIMQDNTLTPLLTAFLSAAQAVASENSPLTIEAA